MKIAVQGFVLRNEFANNFKDIIKELKEKGFGGIEIGLYFDDKNKELIKEVEKITGYFGGQLPACIWTEDEAVDKINYIRNQGLCVESAHIFFTDVYPGFLKEHLQVLIDFAKKNNIKQYVVGYGIQDEVTMKAKIKELKDVSKGLLDEDILLSYHNQWQEMTFINGITILEQLLESVKDLGLQPDNGWMEAGGVAAEYFISKYSERIKSVHFKDLLLSDYEKGGDIICTAIGKGDVKTLDSKETIKNLNLMTCGIIIDQDNARTLIMDELVEGKAFIERNFIR